MPMQDVTTTLSAIAAAAAAGLIVGMERGWSQRDRPAGGRVSGFRTFGLLGLIGGLAGLLPDVIGGALVLVAGLMLAAGYRSDARSGSLSATTAIAGVLTMAIGMSAVRIGATVALAVAAASFALLNARHSLHALLRGLEEAEVEAVARFLLVALVVLPLLPDHAYGPYDAWNPRKIWMVVVMVAGLSFAGYVAARRWGQDRGLLVVAATGGLVSSTAVTLEYARRLQVEPEAAPALTAGIALASVVMFLRVQVLTLVLVPRAAPTLALALLPATLVGASYAYIAWRRQRDQPAPPVKLGNPFDFQPALLLALMVAVLSLAARWALVRFGDGGIAVVLTITGVMDVDAAVMTLSGMPVGTVAAVQAGQLLAGTVLANTLLKAGMAVAVSPGRRGIHAAFPLFAAFAASAATLAVWLWWGPSSF